MAWRWFACKWSFLPQKSYSKRLQEDQQVVGREVFYSGHVQGVGFRMTAHRIAQRWAVTGYVRNLPDGRVQLVVEGERSDVHGYLQALHQTMADHIHDAQVVDTQASGTFSGFAIRH